MSTNSTESLYDRCYRVWACKRCGNCLEHCKHKDESNFQEDLRMPCSVKAPKTVPSPTNSADIVEQGRYFLSHPAWQAVTGSEAKRLVAALCDEVERLRKQQKAHAEMVDDYYGSR